MPRRRCSAFFTLFLFRNQSVTYPAGRPSLRTLIRRIEALGYEVFTIPREIGWGEIPQEDWSFVVTIFLGDNDDSRQLLLIVPLPRRRRRLTRSGAILGSYDSGVSSSGR
jgi:hypothetical protein